MPGPLCRSRWPRAVCRCLALCAAALSLFLPPVTAQGGAAAGPALDRTFAQGGVLFMPPSSGLVPLALASGPDGRVLILAADRAGGPGQLALTRLQPDGAVDLAFGTRGVWRSAPWPRPAGPPFTVQAALTVAPDGRILVAQGDGGAATVYRLSADGERDSSFGTQGQTRLGFSVQAILADPRDRVTLVGRQPNLANEARPVWALARLTADGRKDPAFQGGFVRPFGGLEGEVSAAVLLPDGTFLVAGNQHDAARHHTQPLLVRFQADGRLDAEFGVAGQVRPATHSSCSLNDLTLDSAGRVLAAGWCAPRQHLVVRFTPDGTPDPSFGPGGVRLGPDGLDRIAPPSGGQLTVAGAHLGGEEVTLAFLEQWTAEDPAREGPAATGARSRRLDLSTASWPPLPPGTQFVRVAGLLTDAQGRLLVLAQTHLGPGAQDRNSGALLRFAAPFGLR